MDRQATYAVDVTLTIGRIHAECLSTNFHLKMKCCND